ncbi:uncharacterized protein BJ212DRAFT_1296371 [Suillus subaureus]|uniref:Uncharacterized protein n=1 Tax=Suillus subaureus TaxID=48587 RepID=A0A9P7EJZ6_9AGAM|nr:uncharacterized protein BJ212DRAFT_1296371 [Suillus subaureus]KAG1823835.1 hypothetical protein BJ212DRAFT_1296371 [Suillus subaureus]
MFCNAIRRRFAKRNETSHDSADSVIVQIRGNLDHPDAHGAFQYLKRGQTHVLSKDDAIAKKWKELLDNDPAIATRFAQMPSVSPLHITLLTDQNRPSLAPSILLIQMRRSLLKYSLTVVFSARSNREAVLLKVLLDRGVLSSFESLAVIYLVLHRRVSKTDDQDKDKGICERDDDRKGGHTDVHLARRKNQEEIWVLEDATATHHARMEWREAEAECGNKPIGNC